MEGYCVKCKAKREIQNPTAGFNKRGSAVVFGTCPECGTKIYRIGRTELHEGMTPLPNNQKFFLRSSKAVLWGSFWI